MMVTYRKDTHKKYFATSSLGCDEMKLDSSNQIFLGTKDVHFFGR